MNKLSRLLRAGLLLAFLLPILPDTAHAQRAGSRPAAAPARPAASAYNATGLRSYRSNTLLGDAIIQIDPESRSIVIVADDETHASIAKVIAKLDNPKPQVLIKVVFVEVTFDKDFDVGLEGNYTVKVGGGKTMNVGSFFGLTNVLSNGAYATLDSSNLTATLHALSTSGKAKILSRPSIMARNNQEAVIVVGQEIPIVVNSQITDAGNINSTYRYQDVGVILRVTPFIASDKTVEMIVAPEISSLSNQTVTVSPNVNIPIINKRSAETVVVTPNATTVVIGGLMQKQESKKVEKVPILGSIPLLGIPFRRTVSQEVRSELLIFLTPYIVDSGAGYKRLTVDEANRAQLTRDILTPEDVEDNLDTLRLMPEFDDDGPVIVHTRTIETIPAPTPAKKTVARVQPTPTPKPTPKPKATPKPTPTPKATKTR